MPSRFLKALPIALGFGFYMAGGPGLILTRHWTDMRLQIFLFFAWGSLALLLALKNANKPKGHELDISPWAGVLLFGIAVTFAAGAYLAPDGRRLVVGSAAAVVWTIALYATSVIVGRRQPRLTRFTTARPGAQPASRTPSPRIAPFAQDRVTTGLKTAINVGCLVALFSVINVLEQLAKHTPVNPYAVLARAATVFAICGSGAFVLVCLGVVKPRRPRENSDSRSSNRAPIVQRPRGDSNTRPTV